MFSCNTNKNDNNGWGILGATMGAVGAVAAVGTVSGLTVSAIANRRELSAVYSKAYVEALSYKLPNLIYNLGVVLGAEKATRIADELTATLMDKGVELTEEKAAKAFINTLAQIIANQVGIDKEWVKEGLDHTVKKPLLNKIKEGQKERSATLWQWTKQVTSPLKPVIDPILYSWGEVYANEMEQNGTLDELTVIIKSQVHSSDVEQHRSMNPFSAGLFGAVKNTFFNALSVTASISGAAVGTAVDYLSDDGVYLFEEAVNQALKEKTGNHYDLKQTAKKMGLTSLTEKRFHSSLTPAMKVAHEVTEDIKEVNFSDVLESRLFY